MPGAPKVGGGPGTIKSFCSGSCRRWGEARWKKGEVIAVVVAVIAVVVAAEVVIAAAAAVAFMVHNMHLSLSLSLCICKCVRSAR